MSALSRIREGFDAALAPLPERVTVSLVGGKYDEGTDRFSVRVVVGPPTPEGAERLDALLGRGEGTVHGLLEIDPTLGGSVSTLTVRSHTGHHIFRAHEGADPELGSDVAVEVLRLPER